ncbi:MAG: hypothetical protein RL571_1235 [Pseudomonadota bacterium]
MPWMTEIYYNNASANDSRGAFGTRPLHKICIPGTHDSGCYIDHTINALSKTQTKKIFDQLCGGIRYFDIRPYVKDENFFTFHGPLYTGDQIDGENGILSQIYNFLSSLEESARELIILNISHFYEFNDENHFHLIESIKEKLSNYLVPHKQNEINLFNASYDEILTSRNENIKSRVAIIYDGALDTDNEDFIKNNIENFDNGFFLVSPKYILGKNKPGESIKLKADNGMYIFDNYANSTNTDEMKKDQYDKLKKRQQYHYRKINEEGIFSDIKYVLKKENQFMFPGGPGWPGWKWSANIPNGTRGTLHLLSWTLTPQAKLGNPIEYARKYANPKLLSFFTDPNYWVGNYYDSTIDPQINIIYVDDFDCIFHDNPASPWFGLAMPVAIAARINIGPVGEASSW